MISRRLENTRDSLFENLNNYYEKIKFIFEINPLKFLHIQLLLGNDTITTEVYHKANKFLMPWRSQIPKRYRRNAINEVLYCSLRISSDFHHK